jgi:hypothetical protein
MESGVNIPTAIELAEHVFDIHSCILQYNERDFILCSIFRGQRGRKWVECMDRTARWILKRLFPASKMMLPSENQISDGVFSLSTVGASLSMVAALEPAISEDKDLTGRYQHKRVPVQNTEASGPTNGYIDA